MTDDEEITRETLAILCKHCDRALSIECERKDGDSFLSKGFKCPWCDKVILFGFKGTRFTVSKGHAQSKLIH